MTPSFAPVRLTLSINNLRAADACRLAEWIEEITAQLGRCRPADDEAIDLREWLALPRALERDSVWVLRCAQPAADAKRVAVYASARIARHVERYGCVVGTAARLAAIEAAEAWLVDPTPDRATAAAIVAADAGYLDPATNVARWAAFAAAAESSTAAAIAASTSIREASHATNYASYATFGAARDHILSVLS